MHRWGQSQMFRSLAFYLRERKSEKLKSEAPSETVEAREIRFERVDFDHLLISASCSHCNAFNVLNVVTIYWALLGLHSAFEIRASELRRVYPFTHVRHLRPV